MKITKWNTTGHPFTVEYDTAVLDEVAAAAMAGYRRSPAGGTEIGSEMPSQRFVAWRAASRDLRQAGSVRQFASMSGASIRSKCRVLLVTSTAPTDRACAAIIMSSSPIRRPAVTS